MICNTIEKSFEYLKEIFKNNAFEIKKDGTKIILIFSQTYLNVQVTFDIQLQQEEISTLEAMISINHSLLQLEKKNEKQEEVIKSQQNEIDELKQQISDLKRIVMKEDMYSKILYQKDLGTINSWFKEGNKKMQLKLLYRASDDGFQVANFYKKVDNISSTLVVVKTTTKRRFGGYTDLLWKPNNQYFASNLNKSFIFSLDNNQKCTSNDTNCQKAIYGYTDRIAFGGGNDICACENSQFSVSNYTIHPNASSSCRYGKNEGLNEYISGQYNFTTKEIEAFQIIFQ